MGGDPVGEPPTVSTYAEMFTKLCPEYMALGMSYDDYWHKPTYVHKAYRKAHEIRMRNEEWARWRQGAYIYDALLRVAPVLRAFGKGNVEPGKYPDEPWPLTEEEAKEQEQRRDFENTKRFIAQLEAESEAAKRKQAGKGATEDGDREH